MYFIVLGSDADDCAALRDLTRPRHRAYLRQPAPHQVKVHCGGPTLDTAGEQMNGTLLIVEADSLAEVERFVADDPYAQAGLFSSIVVRPWQWSLGAPELAS